VFVIAAQCPTGDVEGTCGQSLTPRSTHCTTPRLSENAWQCCSVI